MNNLLPWAASLPVIPKILLSALVVGFAVFVLIVLWSTPEPPEPSSKAQNSVAAPPSGGTTTPQPSSGSAAPMKSENPSPDRRPTEASRARTSERGSSLTVDVQSDTRELPHQTIINSPGAIQAGRDVIISADPQLVRSLELRISVEASTAPATAGPEAVDVGLGSAVALFTTEKQRFRFVSDYQVHDQQVAETRRRIRFVYSPEDPTQVLGQPIESLGKIEVLAVNYAEILKTEKFEATDGAVMECGVILNGIPIAKIRADVQPTGLLNQGQANINVADMFRKIPAAYRAALEGRR